MPLECTYSTVNVFHFYVHVCMRIFQPSSPITPNTLSVIAKKKMDRDFHRALQTGYATVRLIAAVTLQETNWKHKSGESRCACIGRRYRWLNRGRRTVDPSYLDRASPRERSRDFAGISFPLCILRFFERPTYIIFGIQLFARNYHSSLESNTITQAR